MPELDDDQTPFQVAEGKPSTPSAPAGPPDLFGGMDTSRARPRHQSTPEERTAREHERRKSIDIHKKQIETDPASMPTDDAQWKDWAASLSPTHLDWAMKLHEKLKSSGFKQGLRTPPKELEKVPGARDAITTLFKNTMQSWYGRSERRSRKPDTHEERPGDNFFQAPPGAQREKRGELKDFDDVIPMLGGRVQTAEREPESEMMGDDGGQAPV